jgi:hypothetical protein
MSTASLVRLGKPWMSLEGHWKDFKLAQGNFNLLRPFLSLVRSRESPDIHRQMRSGPLSVLTIEAKSSGGNLFSIGSEVQMTTQLFRPIVHRSSFTQNTFWW